MEAPDDSVVKNGISEADRTDELSEKDHINTVKELSEKDCINTENELSEKVCINTENELSEKDHINTVNELSEKDCINTENELSEKDCINTENELIVPSTVHDEQEKKENGLCTEQQLLNNNKKNGECEKTEDNEASDEMVRVHGCDNQVTEEVSEDHPASLCNSEPQYTDELLAINSPQTPDYPKGSEEAFESLLNSVDEMLANQNTDNYRQNPHDDSETSTDSEESSDSSSEESSSDSSIDSEILEVNVEKSSKEKELKPQPHKHQAPFTRGELKFSDLPPIEDLHISLPKEDIQRIGSVHSIVDCLVVVQSFPGSPALDLDSVLFLENDKPLGQVFDVLGQVTQPCYAVRFNKEEDIAEQGIELGMAVFYAPSHSEITSFVFLEQLKKLKGSDASWEHNNEPPERYLDYSDDEEERKARAKLRHQNQEKAKSEGNDNTPNKVQCIRPPNKTRRQLYHQNGNHPIPNGFPLLRPPRFRHDHPRHPLHRDRFPPPRPWFGSSPGPEFPRPEFQRPYNRFCGNRFERPVGPSAQSAPFRSSIDSGSPSFRHFGPSSFMGSPSFSPHPPNNQPNFGHPNNQPNFGTPNNFGQSHNPLTSPGFNFSGSNQGSCPLPQWKTPGFPSPPPPDGTPRFPPVGFVSNSNFRSSF